MQTHALSWLLSWSIMLALGLLFTLALVGCERGGGPTATPSLVTPPANAAGGATAAADPTAAEQTRALAQRLAAASSSSDDAAAGPWAPREIDAGFDPFADAAPLPAQLPAPSPSASTSTPTPTEAQAALASLEKRGIDAFEGAGSAKVPGPSEDLATLLAAAPTALPAPTPLSRGELIEELLQHVHHGEDPAMVKAVTAAALSLAHDEPRLDPRLLEPLKPMQREAVQRLHTLLVSLQQQAASRDVADRAALGRAFDRKSLESAIHDAFDAMPLTIVHAQLCRSVSGYGVYEPLAGSSFLSGRPNRAIIYVEVEDFATAALDDRQREVRLMQELILYKENDGLAVWRHEPTQIVDVSRNRRRDFYIVQMITLPARLSEGRYRLKVRVTDQHGGAVDETTLRIQVVADADLLGQPTP